MRGRLPNLAFGDRMGTGILSPKARFGRRPLLALVAALAASCTPTQDDRAIEFRVPVFVREVATGAVEDRIVATGTLRAPETVALRADTAGELQIGRDGAGHRLAEGDRVQKGQTIAEITGEEVRLQARSEATTQRYEAALRDFESKQRLFDDGLLSEQEYRQVKTALTEAQVERDQSRLTESRSRLTTPIAGVLLRLGRDEQGRPLADGQLIKQGFEVAQIAPLGNLVADVDLVGPDVARVREGLLTRVRHDAGDAETFEGRVVRLAPAIDSVTRTLRAEVAVSNREGRLRPGMFVEVTMVAE